MPMGHQRLQCLRLQNNTSKTLTVKVMPNDDFIDDATAAVGATIKAGQKVMNALDIAGSHGRKKMSEIGVLDTVEIAPERTREIRVPAKVNAIGGELVINKVRVTGSIGLTKKSGRCSGIPLDGQTKAIRFKEHKTIGGVKCVKTYKE